MSIPMALGEPVFHAFDAVSNGCQHPDQANAATLHWCWWSQPYSFAAHWVWAPTFLLHNSFTALCFAALLFESVPFWLALSLIWRLLHLQLVLVEPAIHTFSAVGLGANSFTAPFFYALCFALCFCCVRTVQGWPHQFLDSLPA